MIAVIERPAVIRQILDHLGLSTGAASLRAPLDPSKGLVNDPPRECSYEPFSDDLPVPSSDARIAGAEGLVCPVRPPPLPSRRLIPVDTPSRPW